MRNDPIMVFTALRASPKLSRRSVTLRKLCETGPIPSRAYWIESAIALQPILMYSEGGDEKTRKDRVERRGKAENV